MSESEEEKRGTWESIKEIWAIVKACLTCFWFWVPVLFSAFLYLELYLLISFPVACIVILGVFIVLALYWEDKRAKAKYGIKDVRVLLSSEPLFTTPRRVSKKDMSELVDEYKRLLREKKETKKE